MSSVLATAAGASSTGVGEPSPSVAGAVTGLWSASSRTALGRPVSAQATLPALVNDSRANDRPVAPGTRSAVIVTVVHVGTSVEGEPVAPVGGAEPVGTADEELGAGVSEGTADEDPTTGLPDGGAVTDGAGPPPEEEHPATVMTVVTSRAAVSSRYAGPW